MFTKYNPIRIFVLIFATIVLSACVSRGAASSGSITLRLAISDARQETHSESIVLEFTDQVKKLSNGDIIVKPVWDAGKGTQAGFESGVVQLVRDGKADIGLAASRAWDSQDITSFQPLQAPFLIDSDTLAIAVATSDISTKMLDTVSKYGIIGLTLWPEDLRHPFSTIPDKPILSPTDFTGRKIRVTGSVVTEKLIETLGGIPMHGESGYEGAESGLQQAGTLVGTPTATANITFFPKYQVLFANKASFEKLTEAQQAILHQAAAAAQKKAIAEHPSEVDAAGKWCSDSGSVVLASAEQITAFEKAAQPVFDWIEQDPQNAEMIVAIRELKAKTPPSPAVPACTSGIVQQIPTQEPDTQTWSTGLPPNGSWQVTLTGEEVMKLGVSKARVPKWSGVFTHTFKDGVFHTTWQGTEGDAKGQTGSCDGIYKLVEDYVSVTLSSDCGNEVYNIRWRVDSDGLHLHVVSVQNGSTMEVTAILEAKPYQKIADK